MLGGPAGGAIGGFVGGQFADFIYQQLAPKNAEVPVEPKLGIVPFTGGQGVCQVYYVKVNIYRPNGNFFATTQDLPYWGKIGGARVVYGGANGDAVQIFSQGAE